MKSKRAKEYISDICKTSATLYDGDPGECDLKLKDAKHAVELAEEDMIEEAGRVFCKRCEMCDDDLTCMVGYKREECSIVIGFMEEIRTGSTNRFVRL